MVRQNGTWFFDFKNDFISELVYKRLSVAMKFPVGCCWIHFLLKQSKRKCANILFHHVGLILNVYRNISLCNRLHNMVISLDSIYVARRKGEKPPLLARPIGLFLVPVVMLQSAALCVIHVRRGIRRSLTLDWQHIFVFVTYVLGNIETVAVAVVTEHLPQVG